MITKQPVRWKTHIKLDGSVYTSAKLGSVEVWYREGVLNIKPLGGYSSKRFHYFSEKAAMEYIPKGKTTAAITLSWVEDHYEVRLLQPQSSCRE